MSKISATAANIETRQSMVRVWLAISAIWVTFWLLIAAIALLTVDARYSLARELGAFALIVVAPPLCLLAVGAIGRWLLDASVRALARPRLIR